MAKSGPEDPNFTLVGAIAAAVIVAGYFFMLQTSGYFEGVAKAEHVRVETDQAEDLPQR